VQSSDVVTERRRTQNATVLDHVTANSLITHLERAHLRQAVLRDRPHNLPHISTFSHFLASWKVTIVGSRSLGAEMFSGIWEIA